MSAFILMWLFTSNRSASAEMIGWAKVCLQVLKDIQHLFVIVLVQDEISIKCVSDYFILIASCSVVYLSWVMFWWVSSGWAYPARGPACIWNSSA